MARVCGIHHSEGRFGCQISVSGRKVTIEFDEYKLAAGAALAKLMTLESRALLQGELSELSGADVRSFKAATAEAVGLLRGIIEPYFAGVKLTL